jgi:pyrimidine operon attenuation protein/uracil phosphoribosyltransferase
MPAPAASPAPGPGADHTVLDASDISRALSRISHEILERNKGADDVVLLGIPSRGVPLAERIAERIAAVEGASVPSGSLDVTMYRDDLRLKPARTLLPTQIPEGGIDDKVVVLVDDVLFSGRTIRAALDALNDVGRPGGSSSPCWSTAATASFRSAPTSSARTSPPRWSSGCGSTSPASTTRTR